MWCGAKKYELENDQANTELRSIDTEVIQH